MANPVRLTIVNDDPGDPWEARIIRASDDADDKKLAWSAALELRDRILVDAVEAGMTVRSVAKLARISDGRVIAIMAGT